MEVSSPQEKLYICFLSMCKIFFRTWVLRNDNIAFRAHTSYRYASQEWTTSSFIVIATENGKWRKMCYVKQGEKNVALLFFLKKELTHAVLIVTAIITIRVKICLWSL